MGNPAIKGRMISKSISSSRGFASLSKESAILFCLLIPHFNSHGKMNGGAGYIKDEVCPLVPYFNYSNIPKYLKEISEKTSVKLFESNARVWIHSLNFLSSHQKLDKSKMGRDLLPTYPRLTLDLLPHKEEVEVKEEVKGEVKGEGEEEGKKEVKKTPRLSPLSKLWNEICFDSPKVVEVTTGRMKKEKLRLKQRPLIDWEPIFNKISLSVFCLGDNDRGWKATFDWIIENQENSLKVIEGKYDSKVKPTRIQEINNEFEKFKNRSQSK